MSPNKIVRQISDDALPSAHTRQRGGKNVFEFFCFFFPAYFIDLMEKNNILCVLQSADRPELTASTSPKKVRLIPSDYDSVGSKYEIIAIKAKHIQ